MSNLNTVTIDVTGVQAAPGVQIYTFGGPIPRAPNTHPVLDWLWYSCAASGAVQFFLAPASPLPVVPENVCQIANESTANLLQSCIPVPVNQLALVPALVPFALYIIKADAGAGFVRLCSHDRESPV